MTSAYAITDSIVEDPNGGTASLKGDPLPTTGYYVGGKVCALILDSDEYDDIETIDYFVSYLLDTVKAEFIGWWTDSEDGRLYIDASDWFEDHESALRAARRRHELAFWDVENDSEIRV